MDQTFRASTTIPLPIERVFPFFADAANLERVTPPELRFQILSPLPIVMKPGALIEYRLRLSGVPFRWTTRIVEWDPPRGFVDEQLRGPYALWVHTHTFEPKGSETVIRDEVRYRLPFSPLGDLALPFVRGQIQRIFDYRATAVAAAFGADGA